MAAVHLESARQVLFRKGLDGIDVLDRADGQAFDVHAVQGILAVDASTLGATRPVVLETCTATRATTCGALAAHLIHRR